MDNNGINFSLERINDILLTLSSNIDNLKLETSPEKATYCLFKYIKKILELDDNTRKNVLQEWKYGREFEYTYKEHCNNKQMNYNLTWEESFTTTLILFIFH